MNINTIICISREFGSGGREVGKLLSEKLEIPVYDKEIISRVAKESDMSEEFVKNHEGSPIYSHILCVPMGHPIFGAKYDEVMTPEKLFHVQSKVIQEIAEEEKSCIFVGRCADVILQGRENCFRFFIHRPREERVQRIVETEHVSEKEALKMIKKTDWERSSYHNYYTGIKWGHPTNYDMILNMARMDIEKAVRIIEDYVKE